ncbi:MAG: hypothetical protein GC147_08630 [Porphyrobacter sp.]|nr:hypothetical protein [Porphyrobacter sp.]
MPTMITLSLLLNLAVLVPVTGSIIGNAGWTLAAYGPPSPARGIVLAVYLAILAGSVALLWRPVPEMVAVLLLVQIAYKLLTPFTVGTLANPVVASNLAIAAFHAVTVALIVKNAAQ